MREMRRSRQALTMAECEEILNRGTSGVLAVAGDDGYPYAVPMSYAWQEGRLLFHCAAAGHKLDAIRREERASFCVIDRDQVVPEKYTTFYRSVIVFGRVRELEDRLEKRAAIEALAAKYRPGYEAERKAEIDGAWDRFVMLELRPEQVTGKEAIELVRQRERGAD